MIFFSSVKRDRASSIRDGNRRYGESRIAPGTCRMYAKCLSAAKMSDDLQNEDNFRLRDVSSGREANERTSSESIRDLEPRYTSRIARKVEYSVKCVSEWNHKRASMAQPVLTADAVNSMRHGSPQKQQLHEKWLARGVKVASRGSLSARDRARIICPAYPWRLLIFHGLWKLIGRLNANSLPPKSRCVARGHRKQSGVSKLVAGGQIDARKRIHRILGHPDRASGETYRRGTSFRGIARRGGRSDLRSVAATRIATNEVSGRAERETRN